MATETKTEYKLTKILAGVVLALAVVALTLVAILQPDQLPALAGVLVPVAMGALAILGGAYSISRGNAKSGGPLVVLALVLALGVSGCAAFASIPWDKVIAAGGVLVEAGKVITPITCAGMERLGAPAADIARCKKADSIIKNTVGPLYGIGVGIAGTMATTTPVEVPGVGPVQVMALAPGLKPFKIGDKPRVIGFDTVQPVDSKPLEIK